MINYLFRLTKMFSVRFRNFYKRNEVAFWSVGLFVFAHVFWWQIQQNPALVPVEKRRRYLGPIKIIYLDELDFFKKADKKEE